MGTAFVLAGEPTAPPVIDRAPAAGAHQRGEVKKQKPGTEDWPSFRHDSAQSGVAGCQLPAKLELCWTRACGTEGSMIHGSAAIVGDEVFVPSLNGQLLCLALADGQVRWTYHSTDKRDPKSFLPGFKASPLVTDSSVYVGDEEGVFHAVDRATGRRKWTFATQAEIISSAEAHGDQVVFGSYDSNLYCLASDGKLVWKFTTEDRVNCSPAVVDHFTFVAGCDAHLRVIDILTGQQARDIPLGTYLIASPAVKGDLLYVGDFESEVIALNWKTGEKTWTFRDPARQFPYHSSAAVTDYVVVVGGQDKRIHCLDRKTGAERWSFETKGKVNSSPVIVGDRVFVGSLDRNVYGLRLSDGSEVWRFSGTQGFSASPAVGRGRLVIGSEAADGPIYCFGEAAAPSK